ncbi:S8 family serine peptidase [Chenggangzhangella methanolivorans]|uniref:S8 family serine peptidase n=1 Tax=Chenggangzhangella methanolivorans TaxID=1437009 RepID=UPI00361C3E47
MAIVPRGTFAVRPAVAPPPPSGVNKDQVLVAAQKLLGVDKLAKAGLTGAGYSIVMIDGGVDLTVRAMKRAVVDGFCFSRTDKKLGMTSSCPAGVKFGARSLAAGSQTCAFAGCEHGTMVASVIVGSDTASEYRGFARDVKIISINTLRKLAKPDKDGNLYAIYFDDVLAAIERVNAEVMTPKKKALKYRIGALNISLGMECSGFRFAYGADEIYNMRRSRSVATVAAAGNGGSFDDDDAKSDWPACATYAERVGEVAMDYTLGENPITNRADRYAVSEGLPVMAASVGQGRYAMERRRGTSLAAPQLSAAHVLGLQAGTIGLLAAPKIPIALGKRAPGVGAEGVGYVPRVDAAAASLRRFDTFVPAVPKFDYFNWTTNRPEIAAACIDEEKYDRNIANNTFYKFRTSGCQSSKIFTFYGPSFSGKKNKLKIKGVGMIRDEVIDGASNGEWFTAGRERDNETVWNWPYPFFNTEAVIVNAEGGVVERLSVNVAKKVVRCSGPAESTKDESSTCKCVSGCEYDVDYK